MKFTIEQYQELKAAIVKLVTSGVKSVQYGNKTVTYMDLKDLREALKMMEEDLFPERFGRVRKIVEFDRGFNRKCSV